MDVFIGQRFLIRANGDTFYESYYFYGADRVIANSWRVNFCHTSENHESGRTYCCSTPFCLNIEEGSSLRIPDCFVYRQKNNSFRAEVTNIWSHDKGQIPVLYVKFVHIGSDFLDIEYGIAK